MTRTQPTSFVPSKQLKRALLKDKKRTGRSITYLVNEILMQYYFPHKMTDFAKLDVVISKSGTDANIKFDGLAPKNKSGTIKLNK